MAGILQFGAYVPRRRLQRSVVYAANAWFAPGLRGLARGERAVANWDEDVVTMAVEAARDCLHERERGALAGLFLASTSFPFADRQNSGIVKEALGLPDTVATLDAGGSQKAGTSLLARILAGVATDGPALVIGAEKRPAQPASEGELTNGDAAAAFLVGAEDGVARLVGTYSTSTDFVDHFRRSGADFDYGWEARWVREAYVEIGGRAIRDALDRFGVEAGSIDHFVAGLPGRGTAAALARAAKIPDAAIHPTLDDVLGHAGSAHALVMLAHVLETAQPGRKILVVGFGQGADVLLLETTAAIATAPRGAGVSGWLTRGVKEQNYLKHLAFSGLLRLELGKRAEFEQKPVLTALYRNRKTVLALIGGRCTRTGTIQFPKSEISVNRNDAAVGTQEDYPLADRTAHILTFTADNLTYTPDPPNYYGMIDFDGGGRMLAEFTDVDAANDAIEVGREMRMMFRIKAADERTGFTKYFWKAAPAVARS